MQGLDIHLIAIGGTGMAPLACLLQGLGHRVRGSDGPLYPPMSTLLSAAGIEPKVGFDPAHLEPRPDLVIVGNAVPRSNPEAVAAEEAGIERISMPQALSRFLLEGRRPLVVAGTHGKTTTTAIAATLYQRAGHDPGYLIGGAPLDLDAAFHAGSGERFIIEGDEYNAAYFDRGPKFLHYRPETVILTSAEYDHADLYETPEKLLDAYRALVTLVPGSGLLVACGDTPAVRELARSATCRVVTYGLSEDNDLHPVGAVEHDADGTRATIVDPEGGTAELALRVTGEHNLLNALAVWAVARADGIPAEIALAGLAAFHGVRRRMEVVGEADGVLVVDDFAHHPTAVEVTLDALRRRYPGRRLSALFEPRSLTAARALFQEEYAAAFAGADHVGFGPIFHAERFDAEERLDLERLQRELAARGVETHAAASTDELLEHEVGRAAAGDVVVTMSSGSFDGLPHRLVEALAARER